MFKLDFLILSTSLKSSLINKKVTSEDVPPVLKIVMERETQEIEENGINNKEVINILTY